MLERTPRHDSQANLAERAMRTLEEQVKVVRLAFEMRTGAELLANSCLWPWLIRHAGWLDARFLVKTKEPRHIKTHMTAHIQSELLPFDELVLFHIPLLQTRRTILF